MELGFETSVLKQISNVHTLEFGDTVGVIVYFIIIQRDLRIVSPKNNHQDRVRGIHLHV